MVFSILGGFEDQRLTRAVDEVWPLFRDLRSVLWRFPACVLARGMGFPVDELLSIAGCVEDFTLCIAPRADLASRFDSGNVAAEQLWNCFSGGASTPAEIANRIGILSQACEATAGLIGNSIAGFPATVDEVSRLDPAVQNTRRFTAAPSTTIQGVTVDAGSTVLVILARTFPNGAGRHECAAFGLATAIAGHGVSRISRNIRPIGYRPSPNTRIPEFEPQELKQ